MGKATIYLIEQEPGLVDVEIVLDPVLTEDQKIGQEDLSDVQILAGILSNVLNEVLKYDDEPESEETPVN